MGNTHNIERRDIKKIYNYINCERYLIKILNKNPQYINIIFTNESLLDQLLQNIKLFKLLLSFKPNLSQVINNSSCFEPNHTVNNMEIIPYIVVNGTYNHLKILDDNNIDLNVIRYIDHQIKILEQYLCDFNNIGNKKQLEKLYTNKKWIENETWKIKFDRFYDRELFDILFKNVKIIIISYLI